MAGESKARWRQQSGSHGTHRGRCGGRSRCSARGAAIRSIAALCAVAMAALLLGCFEGPPDPTPARALEDTRRSLSAGDVVGKRGRYDSHAWLGIPYAQPPVGELRWRAPRRLPRWQEVREAVRFGESCTQFASRMGGDTSAPPGTVTGGEDCLTLNVWAPPFAPDAVPRGTERLPVLVWIHGGGNSIGTSAFYDGGNLAASEQLIVVSINYRLGPFGWFHHPGLGGSGTSALDRSGNFGTLDQIHALEWVRDNIESFGGDPHRVTIFGESAGGRNVLALVLSPRAAGLFHGAIVQSGGLRFTPPAEGWHLADAAQPGSERSSGEILLQLLQEDGAAADREAARERAGSMSRDEIAAYLRAKSAPELLEAYRPDAGTGMIFFPQLFADGMVLPAEPAMARIRRGIYNRVPIILGTNRDENKLFMVLDPDYSELWLDVLPRLRDPERFELHAEYRSKMWKATGADGPARELHRVQGKSVYVYRFDWDEEPNFFGVFDFSRLIGAAHGFEIPFVFGHFSLGDVGGLLFTRRNREGRMELARAMMGYWAEFARTGRPGQGGKDDLPSWPAWDDSLPDATRFLVFDTQAGGGIRPSAEEVSVERVIQQVADDARLKDDRERCAILWRFAERGRAVTPEDYPRLAGGLCARFPYDAHPWDEG